MIESHKALTMDFITLQVAESKENYINGQNDLQNSLIKASRDQEEIRQLTRAILDSEEENSKLREQIQQQDENLLQYDCNHQGSLLKTTATIEELETELQ